MIHKIQNYDGPLSANKLTGHARTAAICYDNQRRRCYCKSNPRFKDNGAKGFTVDYSKRDFIAWYLHHIKLFKGKNPSVGRIDHSIGYSFDNIRIESLEDNSMERIIRCGPTKERRRILIIDLITGESIFVAESAREAARLTGIHAAHVSKYCSGVLKSSSNGFTLRYADHVDMDSIQSL
jgi:hypothetical protein